MSALNPDLTHAPAADTDAVVTLPATTGGWSLRGVLVSYSATPDPDCKLTVKNDGVVCLQCYVTAAGPAPIEFVGGVQGSDNKAVVVTLDAGGASVKGSVTVILAN